MRKYVIEFVGVFSEFYDVVSTSRQMQGLTTYKRYLQYGENQSTRKSVFKNVRRPIANSVEQGKVQFQSNETESHGYNIYCKKNHFPEQE